MRPHTASLSRALLLTLVLSSTACLLVAPKMLSRRSVPEPPIDMTAPPAAQAESAYGRMPLSFEANRGQAGASVDFLARGAGYALYLKPTEVGLILTRGSGAASSRVLRMRLDGANSSARAEGVDELEGKVNYLVGDDPAKWQTGVPTYAGVRYEGVYTGVDVFYYGNQRQLEYDFRIAPGADPRAVSLEFEGADGVQVDGAGDLLLALGDGVVRQPKPFVYQEVGGDRRAVEGGYVLDADGRVRFTLGEYDEGLPLVINPVIVYSTYLGGSGFEIAGAVAVDSAGSAYMTGYTGSANFPTGVNPLQPGNAGPSNIFITKLNAAGTAFAYSTYFGGSGDERALDIAVDSAGNAYLTGSTRSANLPTINAFQPALKNNDSNTGQDIFITKLNATGTALVYSTYLGGSFNETGLGIAVDSAGSAYVTGDVGSRDFPTTPGAIKRTKGEFGGDAFVTKLSPAGNALAYSTYLGGEAFDNSDTGTDIAVDCAGNAYVTGYTYSSDFPTTPGAFQPTYIGAPRGADFPKSDAFVTKFDPTGTALVYSTYLGGDGRDEGQGIAIDAAGSAYVTGLTMSFNFPTANAIQPNNNAVAGVAEEAFVTKLNASGSAPVYSTYLGGGSGEVAQGIAINAGGNAYVTGATTSTNFPTVNAVQNTFGGESDAFVTKINAAGSAFVYSTYLGGSGISSDEQGVGVAVDSAGSAYVFGHTGSTDFPTVNPIQATNAGAGGTFPSFDAFVTKIAEPTTGAASQFQFTQTSVSVQEAMTFVTLTVQRTGDATQPATVDYATADCAASERRDYTTAVGTLRFAAGETTKTFDVLVNEDSFVEGSETFNVALSNTTGGATLSCGTAVVTVQITDDAAEPSTNVIDDPTIFVDQHYRDFLNRESDAAGLAFWANQIIACGADAACIEPDARQRLAGVLPLDRVSGDGLLRLPPLQGDVHGRAGPPARDAALPRVPARLAGDRARRRGRGVELGAAACGEQQEFSRRWVQRPDFVAQFPLTMTAAQFVDKLFQNTSATPTTAERDAAIAAYGPGDTEGRAAALRSVVESGTVYNRQFNAAFVLSQYIGYLRRNPNDAPDADYAGFDFWLAKLDSFSLPGEDVRNEQTAISRAQRAEMVRAFILSAEYRGRFGQ